MSWLNVRLNIIEFNYVLSSSTYKFDKIPRLYVLDPSPLNLESFQTKY